MVRRTRSGCYTFANFVELIPEDQKADLIDGVIYLASPENIEHNMIILWLSRLIGLFLESRPLGVITVNKVAYRLEDPHGPEPDLAFVKADRVHLLKRGYVDGAPDLAVEIVSPDSVQRDYEDKRRLYERFGVGEYWIIDPDETTATFLIRDATGFTEARLDDGDFRSRVLPGLAIDPLWLWQRPLPATLTPL
jgi:Uma2 family endonuclease